MNTEFYNLDKPVEQIILNIIVKFAIIDIVINPFKSANIYINLYNDKDEGVASKNLLMEGEAYEMWGDNDDYLIEWIKIQIEK